MGQDTYTKGSFYKAPKNANNDYSSSLNQSELEGEKGKIVEEMKKLKNLKISKEEINKNMNFYIAKLETFQKINDIINIAKEAKFYSSQSPQKVYSLIYGENTLPEKWEGLFSLKNTDEEYDKLYIASRIRKIKHLYYEMNMDKSKNYKYYSKLIDLTNYETYENKYDEYHKTYEILIEIQNLLSYIKKNIFYLDLEGMHHRYEEQRNEYNKLNITNFDTPVDQETLLSIKEKCAELKKIMIKSKKEYKAWKETEEREESNEENHHYTSYNTDSGISSSNNNSSNSDLKKKLVRLCQNCKNKCIACGTQIKGGNAVSKGFGLHEKCQTSSCYSCGSTSNTNERQSSYLCKPCYNSHKYDVAYCLNCHKSFK